MNINKLEPKYMKQGLAKKLDKIEELETSIEESLKRLGTLKPTSFHENEVVEVLKQIARNQTELSKIISHIIKYVYRTQKNNADIKIV